MRHRFIITASTVGALACGQPVVHANPPEPEVLVPPKPASVDVKLASERERVAGSPTAPVPLNAYSEKHGMVYKSREGDKCIVFPDDGVQRNPGQMPPPADSPCSPLMMDPIWQECAYGTIYDRGEAGCTCFVGGNPPPPEKPLSRCPVHP